MGTEIMGETGKPYKKVMDYVKRGILDGTFVPGDRLEPERDLALKLGISRNSVREGLRALELIGLLSSRQGSGNFISLNFDETMTEMLTSMYYLKGLQEDQVTEFRFSIEWEALQLAVERADEEQKRRAWLALIRLEEAQTEETMYQVCRRVNEMYFGLLLLDEQIRLNGDLQTLLT